MILRTVALGEGPPACLLHGLFGSAQSFGTIQRRLADKFRLIGFDLRNHGGSPHAPGMDYATLAEDVRETMAALALGPCPVVGHSMGGKVAMRLALDRPDCVSRLLVSDIAPAPTQAVFRRYADAMVRLALWPGLTRAAASQALAEDVPDAAVRAFLLQNLRFGPASGPAPVWRIGLDDIIAGFADIEDWPASDRHYAGPTLFVAGDRSDYIRPEHRPAIRALFPQARFVTIRDAGHWVHSDNPAAFAGVLEVFLATT